MAMESEKPDETRAKIEKLKPFVTEARFRRLTEVLAQRTRHITVALEDIYQPHNASAVLRTCDCFGLQEVHIIENRNRYEVNADVALGAAKWLDLIRYRGKENNTPDCLNALKAAGYRIVATSPHAGGYTPETLPLDRKVALLFGTELEGLTSGALEMADDTILIPMCGFTESLNISVSAAILIHTLTQRLRNPANAPHLPIASCRLPTTDWRLPTEDSDRLLLHWLMGSIKGAEGILRRMTSD